LLRSLRDQLAKREDEIAATITAEVGCPTRTATRIQAALPQTVVGSYADLLEKYEFYKIKPQGYWFESNRGSAAPGQRPVVPCRGDQIVAATHHELPVTSLRRGRIGSAW